MNFQNMCNARETKRLEDGLRGRDWREELWWRLEARERGRGMRENEWWSCGRQRLEARKRGRGVKENGGRAAEIGSKV
ncbi:hypothetical protein TIFTF001_033189 [Ficus carica]|uniref:Uncharacterized protein n=1 Tax=Ficus carica TaxID=3494 RepID=A0AA88E4T7_FICCA|nr:hypothetical protein TIFTF001_033189 [Ficus carica]